MKHFYLTILAIFCVCNVVSAAEELLTVDRLFGFREFETESIPAFTWSGKPSVMYTLDKVAKGEGFDLVRNDPATGERLERNKGEQMMLIVSEIA